MAKKSEKAVRSLSNEEMNQIVSKAVDTIKEDQRANGDREIFLFAVFVCLFIIALVIGKAITSIGTRVYTQQRYLQTYSERTVPVGADESVTDRSSDEVSSVISDKGASAALAPLSQPVAQRINLNTADAQLLKTLPFIGEVKAEAIIIYRDSVGSFVSTEQLLEVDGIGEKIYEQIKDLVCVE